MSERFDQKPRRTNGEEDEGERQPKRRRLSRKKT